MAGSSNSSSSAGHDRHLLIYCYCHHVVRLQKCTRSVVSSILFIVTVVALRCAVLHRSSGGGVGLVSREIGGSPIVINCTVCLLYPGGGRKGREEEITVNPLHEIIITQRTTVCWSLEMHCWHGSPLILILFWAAAGSPSCYVHPHPSTSSYQDRDLLLLLLSLIVLAPRRRRYSAVRWCAG